MDILQRLTSLLSRSQASSSGLGSSLSLTNYETSPRFGTAQVAASYSTNPNVRDVVGGIAYSVASTRWVLYSIRGKKPKSKSIRHVGAQTCGTYARWELLRSMANDGRLTEIEVHPALELLAAANPQITGFSSRKMSQTTLDLSGETFWELGFDKGVPVTYRPIPPHWVQGVPQPDKMLTPHQLRAIVKMPEENRPALTQENSYSVQTNGGLSERVSQWDMIWVKDPDPTNPYGRGIGIGQTLGDEIETDEFAAKFLKSFFFNSARPELMISLKGASKGVIDAAKAKFENVYRGYQNAHKTFFHDGEMEIKELTGKIKDMQMLELRKHARDTIGTTYHVPPEKRGVIENSNRATSDVADYNYQKEVVVPRLEMWRSELQYKLIHYFDPNLVLDFVSPVPEDKEYRLSVMTAAAHNVTRAEWRKEAGLLDRGEADDVHHIPPQLQVEVAPKPKPRPRLVRSIGQRDLFGVERGEDALSPAAINRVTASLKDTPLVSTTTPVQQEQLQWWADSQMQALGITAGFNMQNPVVQAFLRDYSSTRIKEINETTLKEMRSALIEGVQQGEGQKELAKRVQGVMGHARGYRNDRIARTEAKRAANFGRLESFKQSGVVEKKKWYAQLLNTRDAHLVLHAEQAIKVDGYWSIDSDLSQYPGGFSLPENSINCQCYMQPEMIKIQSESTRAVDDDYDWSAFDEQVEPWINDLSAAFIKGFNEQEAAVLRALEDNSK